MKYLLLALAGVAALSAAPAAQTFTGVITDNNCDRADHSRMHMGPTDAECVLACLDYHGSQYVLYDGKTAYNLSDQLAPAKFAGRTVKVVGTLDPKTKTIKVDSIAATQSK